MNAPASMPARGLPASSAWLSATLAATLWVLLPACGDSTSITEARELATGTAVTVEGAVTVPPGAFQSAMGDEGFALQDSSGGVYVKMTEKQSFGLGAKVRVTGTLDEQNKLRILKAEPTGVEVLGGTKQVSAKVVGTGAVNESVEGRLIQVSGVITQTFQDDLPYGYKLYIDDGSGEFQIFVHASAGFNKGALQELTAGMHLIAVGLAAQYENTYEVAPRSPSDLSAHSH